MVVGMEEAVKEIVAEAVAENANQTKTEILEIEIEMKIEIEHGIYVTVKEQNRMLLDMDKVQSYLKLQTIN